MRKQTSKAGIFSEIGGDDVAFIVGLGMIAGGVLMIWGIAVALIVTGSPIFLAGAYKAMRG